MKMNKNTKKEIKLSIRKFKLEYLLYVVVNE